MNILVRRCAMLLALMMLGTSGAFAQTHISPKVTKIVIEHFGPPAANESLIRANIRTKEGDSYTRNSVDQDIASLYATGFFRNVSVQEERTNDGMTLTYRCMGKPTLTEIQFTGNKRYSRSKLLKITTSKVGEPLDERKLFSDSQEILKKYQKAGYQKTKVKYTPIIVEESGRGQVVFEITEAPRVKIKDIEFVGAKEFSQKKLRKVLKTKRRWMFSWLTGSGVLKDDEWDDDKEKLADFYRNEGFIDFQITDIEYPPLDAKWMKIKIHVAEGRKYKVGLVEFKGNQLFTFRMRSAKGILQARKPTRE